MQSSKTGISMGCFVIADSTKLSYARCPLSSCICPCVLGMPVHLSACPLFIKVQHNLPVYILFHHQGCAQSVPASILFSVLLWSVLYSFVFVLLVLLWQERRVCLVTNFRSIFLFFFALRFLDMNEAESKLFTSHGVSWL